MLYLSFFALYVDDYFVTHVRNAHIRCLAHSITEVRF